MRFIYACMAVVILSIFAVPVFYGISNEREELMWVSEAQAAEEASLSFEEIYEIAGSGNSSSPESLNTLAPAAGPAAEESFKGGFTQEAPAALADIPEEPAAQDKTSPAEEEPQS